jgi:hypothetical protein
MTSSALQCVAEGWRFFIGLHETSYRRCENVAFSDTSGTSPGCLPVADVAAGVTSCGGAWCEAPG